MKLYGNGHSYNSRKVEVTLRHLGLDYTFQCVDLGHGAQRAPEFLALNPNGKVPVLMDGDHVMTESTAIMRYLAATHRPALLGVDARDRYEVERWLCWQLSELGPALSALTWVMAIEPLLTKREANPEAVQQARARLASVTPILDAHLSGRDWICAELSLADLAIGVVLDAGAMVGLTWAEHPAISAWLERVRAQPGWVAPMTWSA